MTAHEQRPVVVVAEPIDEGGVEWLEAQGAVVVRGYRGETWDHLSDRVRGFIYRGQVTLDARFMDSLPALEVIGKHGVGVDTVDLVEAAARGIAVTNTPGANANSVAEHAVALLLAAVRTVVSCHAAVSGGRFAERLGMPLARELRGGRLGIIGFGHIGTRVAEIMAGGFGSSIGYYDPYVPAQGVAHPGASRFDDVGALCTWADDLVVAAPLTSETRGMIGPQELAALGERGVLVISSRGGIVDEGALVHALRGGALAAAGVDVFDREPPELEHALLALPNVVLTPHFGGQSDQALVDIARRVCENVWAVLTGGRAPLVLPGSWT